MRFILAAISIFMSLVSAAPATARADDARAVATPRDVLSAAPQVEAPPPSEQGDRARALRNYGAIQRGHLRFADLTPEEQAEVAEVDRIRRAQGGQPVRTAAERCRDALRTSDQPSALETQLIELRCSQR